MKLSLPMVVLGAIVVALAAAALGVGFRFQTDLALAAERAANGSVVVPTRCGPIEVQQAGAGTPLLMIHGSGGGHDRGMAWARPLAQQGVRVIAMSRFGYLRTPRPADASPEAQADAHVCLLDCPWHRQGRRHGRISGRPVGDADGHPSSEPCQRAGARRTHRLQARRGGRLRSAGI